MNDYIQGTAGRRSPPDVMHGKIWWNLLTLDSHLENKAINRTAGQQREEEKRTALSNNPIVWVFVLVGVGR